MSDAHIRWAIKSDSAQVLEIERQSFSILESWNDEDFAVALRKNSVMMVAELPDESIGGFLVYEGMRFRMDVLNLAVAESNRRQGIAAKLIDKLKSKLSFDKRRTIRVDVLDDNLAAHLFYRSQGFVAVDVMGACLDDADHDAYRFECRCDSEDIDRATARFKTASRQGK